MVDRTHLPDEAAAPTAVTGPQRVRVQDREPVRLVFLCRANRCRSPLAEHLMRQHATKRGFGVVVGSMGFLPAGFSTPDTGVRAAAEYGLDLSEHRSRALDRAELDQADLILALARPEARDLVAEHPGLWPKVYTLKQFAAHTAAQPPAPGTDFAAWVRAAGQARSRSVLLGANTDDDVADPMGKPLRVWRRTLMLLDELLAAVLADCAAALPTTESRDR